MEILGVLLGLTMSALVGCAWYWHTQHIDLLKELIELNERCGDAESRIDTLEHRKAFQPAATPEAAAQTVAAPKLRYRTWNEDAVMPEKSN